MNSIESLITTDATLNRINSIASAGSDKCSGAAVVAVVGIVVARMLLLFFATYFVRFYSYRKIRQTGR